MLDSFLSFLKTKNYSLGNRDRGSVGLFLASNGLSCADVAALFVECFGGADKIVLPKKLYNYDFGCDAFCHKNFRGYIANGFFTAQHKEYGKVVVCYSIDALLDGKNWESCDKVLYMSFAVYQSLLCTIFANSLTKDSVVSRNQNPKAIYFRGRRLYYKFLYFVFSAVALFVLCPVIFWLWYLYNIGLRVVFILCGCVKRYKLRSFKYCTIDDADLPIYTLLLPVYREEKMVAQLVGSISKIDYPRHLMDVKVLVEEGDRVTMRALKKIDLPNFFTVLQIPDSLPKNKPKALNFGFAFARGEYVGVYDAEDVPDPFQLKKVVSSFASMPNNVVALQGSLSYYNGHYNTLTSLFEAEYLLWFDLVLPGINMFTGFLPLGGTTNHCKTQVVEELGRWDAFNVTEDMELSAKMLSAGFGVGYLDSRTKEEAVISLGPWLVQRTRWIKGHIVTMVAYFDSFNYLDTNILLRAGFNHLCFFGVLNPILTCGLVLAGIAEYMQIFHITGFVFVYRFCFWPLVALLIFYVLFSVLKAKFSLVSSIKVALLFPLYYVAQAVACVRAVYQIYKNQEYSWEKTKHGFCLANKEKKF